jgi:hypothetical protein
MRRRRDEGSNHLRDRTAGGCQVEEMERAPTCPQGRLRVSQENRE